MLLMNLPIWRKSKLEPAVREMTAEREMARRDLENLDLESSNSIRGSAATLENSRNLAALFRTTLVPHAETAFEVNLESYRVGKIDFPMLLDSIMTVLNFHRGYHEMLGELYMEKARLEAAVGRELD
jgi:outer membrane protein TolC